MAKPSYSKPALTYAQQLSLLQQRGLHVQNTTKAQHQLTRASTLVPLNA